MFDEKTKQAWQGVTPSPELKERALNQTAPSKKIVSFPAKAVRSTISAVACVVVALMLLNPAPQVSLVGTGPGMSTAAYSRQMPAQQSITLMLETNADTTLTTEDGWVEQDGNTALWHLPGEGEYTLTAVRGRRSTSFCVQVTMTEGARSVTVK